MSSLGVFTALFVLLKKKQRLALNASSSSPYSSVDAVIEIPKQDLNKLKQQDRSYNVNRFYMLSRLLPWSERRNFIEKKIKEYEISVN